MKTFAEYAYQRDKSTYDEVSLRDMWGGVKRGVKKAAMPLAIGAGMALGGTAQAPEERPQTHQQFMAGIQSQLDKGDRDLDNLSAQGDAADDERDQAEIDQENDPEFKGYASRAFERKKAVRKAMGSPSDQAKDKAWLVQNQMDADAKDNSSLAGYFAKKSDLKGWRMQQDLDTQMWLDKGGLEKTMQKKRQ